MLYFSLFSGEIYDSPTELTDPFQIPLKTKPANSCSKCHGRFYTCYLTTNKQYQICNKCVKKYVDAERLLRSVEANRINRKTS